MAFIAMLYTLTGTFPYVEIYCSECIFWTFVFTYFSTGDVGDITQVLHAAEKRHSCECNRRFIYTYIYIYTHTYIIYIRGTFKKGLNFLNSAPTSTESALRLLGAPSVRALQQTAICPVSL